MSIFFLEIIFYKKKLCAHNVGSVSQSRWMADSHYWVVPGPPLIFFKYFFFLFVKVGLPGLDGNEIGAIRFWLAASIHNSISRRVFLGKIFWNNKWWCEAVSLVSLVNRREMHWLIIQFHHNGLKIFFLTIAMGHIVHRNYKSIHSELSWNCICASHYIHEHYRKEGGS